jgi:mannose-binding lectin 1
VKNEGQEAIPPSFLDSTKPTSDKNTADPPEVDADKIRQEQQFADLHNRLQAIMKHVVALQRDYEHGRQAIEKLLSDVQTRVSSIPTGDHASSGEVKAIDKRLEAMELQIQRIKLAVADKGHMEDLKRAVKETHSGLLEAVPRHGFLIIVILGSQALSVAAYVLYKRKQANSPKKYL